MFRTRVITSVIEATKNRNELLAKTMDGIKVEADAKTVSYTHLDVYKRQDLSLGKRKKSHGTKSGEYGGCQTASQKVLCEQT